MKKKHLKVLQEINNKIPKELIMQLTKEVPAFGTLKEVLERALTEPDEKVSKANKAQYRAILDSGILNKKVEVINEDIEKQIDELITAEIDKAVQEGRLPKKAPELHLKSLRNKGKQYARRQTKRLESIFDSDVPEVENEEKNDSQDAG